MGKMRSKEKKKTGKWEVGGHEGCTLLWQIEHTKSKGTTNVLNKLGRARTIGWRLDEPGPWKSENGWRGKVGGRRSKETEMA